MSESQPPASDGRFQTLRGMRDILSDDAAAYRHVEQAFWKIAERHGFAEIRMPVLERTELFTRSVGEATELVHKEMYTFEDRSGESVSLRPEGTAGVARAYLEHGMGSLPQPVKLAYCEDMYRYERPQAGRFREHEQFGLEAFGSSDPALDAQVILTCWQMLEELEIDRPSVQINSLGGPASQKAIRKLITDTVVSHEERLSDDARRQLKENPLRLLDTKDPATREVVEQIPPLVDQLVPEDREHLTAVLEYLDQAGIDYELNPHLVRGFDYYTRTVFEFWGPGGADASLIGGGRYDGLIQSLGGVATPAVGAGCGIYRIVEALKAKRGPKHYSKRSQVYLIQLGDVAKRHAFGLLGDLTKSGVSVTASFGKEGIRSQLRQADKLGVSLALIIGQKEAMENSIIIRDMSSGMQETVPLKEAVAEVQSRLPRDVSRPASG
ncbi:MAG: histidine--tRNA ligase [Patescibacteria group bacterium]